MPRVRDPAPRQSDRRGADRSRSDLRIEFKSSKVDAAARRQVEDYALELADFHRSSDQRQLIPIACAPKAATALGDAVPGPLVLSPSTSPPTDLASLLGTLFELHTDSAASPVCVTEWLESLYEPTPTIIESARALYAGHTVADLSRAEASARQLQSTESAITALAERAIGSNGHAICFLTGIPGAGKTLAGLNAVHRPPSGMKATFLSGNGPLVKVLQGALAEDLVAREGHSKSEAQRRATTFVTNVHKWLDDYNPRVDPPHEDIVIFDEAQRAWNQAQAMRKFKRDASEPEQMLRIMSRRSPSVVVALVGGGQEINTGEAGLAEWGRALAESHTDWHIALAPELLHGDASTAGSALLDFGVTIDPGRITEDPSLHLGVSQRSFRTVKLSQWVEYVLAGKSDQASLLMEELHEYPIVQTRHLDRARHWLRERARGLRRCGLLASSGARRLRQDGITVREPVDEVKWFLAPPEDVRSSNFLELALTEFGVQGLEVDWAGIAWGSNLTRQPDGEGWVMRAFKGTRWQQVRSAEKRAYVLNSYRVLLTRAREGMVLWVPLGSPEDATRDPQALNGVEQYLTACGVRSI